MPLKEYPMIHVRNAERTDTKLLTQLILEMGQHERLPVFVTEERLAADGFGLSPRFRALIAEADGKAAGYALFFDCYSSFQGVGIFLEDLFVRDEFRGKGVGAALLSGVAAKVVHLGYFGVLFNVLDWNQSALQFFKRSGASELSERKTLCLEGIALRELANAELVDASSTSESRQA
jgi:GNAT superfamily N-acetyltransferase